jgi:hypothetical protein
MQQAQKNQPKKITFQQRNAIRSLGRSPKGLKTRAEAERFIRQIMGEQRAATRQYIAHHRRGLVGLK